MTPEDLEEGIKEAERFVLLAKRALENKYASQQTGSIYFRMEDLSAVSHASQDVSKAMVRIRSGRTVPPAATQRRKK